jgi:signal transduction histidine kinase
VIGDAGRLFQVLTNLLENALKFTEHGRVALIARPAQRHNARVGRGGVAVEFVVSDTGIGIGEADQESVFDSFRQVDGSTTRRYGGTGLGLAICKELTRLMGGSITVHSQFGAGSTFVACIPLTPDALRQAASSPSSPDRAQDEDRVSRVAGV